MRLLELFSGTGSIGSVFASRGWDVTSLDILPGATITSDILDWNYKIYPPSHFDFIWASPPCTHYSMARTTAKTPRDFEGADAIVRRTLDIIEYFRPGGWLMENPQTGYLKTRAVVQGLPFRDVCYCKYGFPYRKGTRLWGYLPTFEPRQMCCKRTPCESMEAGRHFATAQRGSVGERHNRFGVRELYRIPPLLCEDIAAAAFSWCLIMGVSSAVGGRNWQGGMPHGSRGVPDGPLLSRPPQLQALGT